MGVGLVRVYNSTANTSKQVLFLPPSDAYVRSFLYLLYTLIKLYCTKALSDQASSLAPDWILLLRGPRIPVSSRDSTTTFQFKSINSLVLSFLYSPTLTSIHDHWKNHSLQKVKMVNFMLCIFCHGLPKWLSHKDSICQCRRHWRLGFDPWVGKIPWRRK